MAEATRRRAEGLAKQIGYQPNPMARGLATRRTNVIGLAVPWAPRSLSDPFYLEFLGYAGDTAMKRGYSLLLSAPEEDGAGAFRSHVELAASARVDGIILTEPKVVDERIGLLREFDVPFVFLGMSSTPDVSWVSGNNRAGAEEAVRHLLGRGHTRIGCVTGPPDQTASVGRFDGYRAALAEAGVALDRNIVAPGDFTQAGGYSAMCEILESGRSITAVYACNDVMALGAMKAARESGRQIPMDLSIVGFDGIAMGEYMDPPLTTVRQPIRELGVAAADILIDQIEGRAQGQVHRVMPVALREGGSTCAVGESHRPR